MTDYAVKHMNQAADDHDRRAAECRTRAADLRASADVEEGRASKEDKRAADLRAAVAKLTADDSQWTKDDLARFHAEGHAALEPNRLSAVNAALGDAIDVRSFQPDGDTYGREFPEPHLG